MNKKGRMKRFKAFCFDGIDGSGKTTLIRQLATHYKSEGYDTQIITSPSQPVRESLASLSPMDQFSVLIEDCKNLSRKMIHYHDDLNVLHPKTIFLLDRWALYTTFAYQLPYISGDYQSMSRGVIYSLLDCDPVVKPDRLFILDCPVQLATFRKTNNDIINAKQEDIRSEFIRLAGSPYFTNITLVNASQSFIEVKDQVIEEMDQILCH